MGEKLKKTYGWIDKQGKVVLKDEFSGAGEFVDGRAPAASGGRNWAYIDTDGNPVLPRKWTFQGARPFSEGLAAAAPKNPNRWMYLSIEGALVIQRVSLRVPRQALGQTVNEAEIGSAGDFHDGLAPILPAMMFDAKELIYIHADGTEAFAPGSDLGLEVCNRLPEFRDGLVQLLVADEGAECGGEGDTTHYVYLDTSGSIVLQEAGSE